MIAAAWGIGCSSPAAPPSPRLSGLVRPTLYEVELDVTPGQPTLSGTARIEVQLDGPAREIELYGEGLEVSRAELLLGGRSVAAEYHEADDTERATLSLAEEVPAGAATLSLTWSTAMRSDLQGVYQVYADGRPYVVTQFQPLAARTALPCFDEPSFKAPLRLTLVTPNEATPLANSPSSVVEALADGRTRTRFAPTPPLPTYLYAFAVGPFERTAAPALPATDRRPREIPVAAYAAPGRSSELEVSLALLPELLVDLEEYFGTPYPFAKLDLVAMPDFEAGAMENPGLLVFRDAILLQPAGASSGRKLLLAQTLAHELAHQWFGNLVSMGWWDDLWLSEGLATWMEHRAVARSAGGERAGESFQVWVQEAMDQDTLSEARQVVQPIHTSSEIYAAFDDITYAKGASVLGMVERRLGPEHFRRSVRDYLGRGFDTATTADFLAGLGAAPTERQEIEGITHSYLHQSGLPLVSLDWTCAEGRAVVDLSQSPYRPRGAQAQERRWHVPVCLRTPDAEICTLLQEERATLALPSCPRWVFPNAGGVGYYRWRLPPEALTELFDAGTDELAPRERVVLADALWTEFALGDADHDRLANGIARLVHSEGASGDLVDSTLAVPRFTRRVQLSPEAERRHQEWIRATYGELWRQVGWQQEPGESESRRALRAPLLEAVGDLGRDPAARAEALDRTRRMLAGEASMAPELRWIAYQVAATEGSPELFEQMTERLLSSEDGSERYVLLQALARFPDPALAERARELSLGPHLRSNEVLEILALQLQDPAQQAAAWSFLERSLPALLPRMSDQARAFLPAIAEPLCDAGLAAKVGHLFSSRPELSGEAATKSLEAIHRCIALAEARRGALESAFSQISAP